MGMSPGYSGRDWVCPYYKWDKKMQVYCEGGTVKLPDRDVFREYVGAYCSALDGWESCSIARALTEYYERTGAKPPE